MRFGANSLLCILLALTALEAATVVTRTERIQGTIQAEDDKSLTVRRENQSEIKIPRASILQIFDDKGDLTWQADLPPEEKRPEPVHEKQTVARLPHAITGDFFLGGVTGGLYSDESRFVDDMRIMAQYNDGTTQYAQSSMSMLGGGLSYRRVNSERFSTLISYAYRLASQSVYIGDGKNYERNTLSSLGLTRIHGVFYGKEAAFFPFTETFSLDIIGQVGYTLGSYSPLITYNDYRTLLTPQPAAYTGIQTATIHGPAARAAAGITFYNGHVQFRLLGFYQISALFLPERTLVINSTSSIVHDYYGSMSIGYGW